MKKLLKWNKLENCFECGRCEGLFGKDDLARAFNYTEDVTKESNPTYCMDCGVLWLSVV